MKECYAKTVIEKALSQVGYIAKGSSKADLDSFTKDAAKDGKYTKYARDLDALKDFYNGRKQGYDWCCVFAQWCFVKAYGREAAQELLHIPNKSLAAGVKYAYLYFSRNQQITTVPEVGAQVFFANKKTNYAHTGIVVALDKNYVYVVEGNAAVGKYREVVKKKYKYNYKYFTGFGIPKYTEEPKRIYTVVKGDSLWKISKKFYGSGLKYRRIMQANNLQSTRIYIGQKLVIPDLNK